MRLQRDTAKTCKLVLITLGLVGIAFTSAAQGTDPTQEIQGFPALAYVTDSRPCPEGTIRLRMPAGPGFEVTCFQSEDGREPSWDPHGPSVLWYPAKVSPPQRYFSGAFRNRRPHGGWTFWDTSGQKEREGSYQDGHAHGLWRFWTADRQKIEAEFHAGELVRILSPADGEALLASLAKQTPEPFTVSPLLHASNEIRGQIVDAETEEPIPGAVVVASWDLGISRAVAYSARLHISEARTDAQGQYVIPGWKYRLLPPLATLSYAAPILKIFKVGYSSKVVDNYDPWRTEPVSESNWNGKTIALDRPQGTLKKQASKLSGLFNLRSQTEYDELNDWHHYPRATLEVLRETERLEALGLERGYSPGQLLSPGQLPRSFNSQTKRYELEPGALEVLQRYEP